MCKTEHIILHVDIAYDIRSVSAPYLQYSTAHKPLYRFTDCASANPEYLCKLKFVPNFFTDCNIIVQYILHQPVFCFLTESFLRLYFFLAHISPPFHVFIKSRSFAFLSFSKLNDLHAHVCLPVRQSCKHVGSLALIISCTHISFYYFSHKKTADISDKPF